MECLENYAKFRFLGPLFTDESPSSLHPLYAERTNTLIASYIPPEPLHRSWRESRPRS